MAKCHSYFFLLLTLFTTASAARAASSPVYAFALQYDGQINAYSKNDNSGSGQINRLRLEQSADFTKEFSGLFQVSTSSNSYAFDAKTTYDVNPTSQNIFEVFPSDFYIQYKTSNFLIRTGYQQVVWGEAFGLFYSDFINPKDLRLSPFTSPEKQRRSLPMLNLKTLFGSSSFQVIATASPDYDILPPLGRQLSKDNLAALGVSQWSITKAAHPALFSKPEYGAKLNSSFWGMDLSGYYMTYDDRLPYYQLTSISGVPTTGVLEEKHQRISSSGVTLAANAFDFVLRAEALKNQNKKFNTLVAGLGTADSDESVSVIGIDTPSFNNYIFSLQFSDSALNKYDTALTRPKYQSLWSTRLTKSLSKQMSWELSTIYAPYDQGGMAHFEFVWPKSKIIEIKFGYEQSFGPRSSDFGRNYDLSALYVNLTADFKD